MTTTTIAEHIAWCIESANDVDVPEDIRAEHRPDPSRIEKGSQCVCTCGSSCPSYAAHLVEQAKHRELWNRLCTEGCHPSEAFARAGIDPRAL